MIMAVAQFQDAVATSCNICAFCFFLSTLFGFGYVIYKGITKKKGI